MRTRSLLIAFAAACASPMPAFAADPAALQACAAVQDSTQRLACYDRAAGRPVAAAPVPVPAPASPAPPGPFRSFDAPPDPSTLPGTQLGRRWELDPGTQQPLFGLRAHNQNYLLVARWSDNPNEKPFRDAAAGAGVVTEGSELNLDPTEVKFQLSLKTKAWQDVLGGGGNLWIGYTQQNHWQVYNDDISRPFRETNYEPEVIYNHPLDWNFLGMRVRYASLAFNHQSNGRADPISRSWNRVYGEVGLERGNFALMVRPWWRIPEDDDEDDNPNITSYVGRGEITGVYSWNRQQFGARVRSNFSLNDTRGSLLADWSFPLVGQLRGYVQFFTGYGESLIDYNWRQTTIGAGVLLTDRL